MSFTLQITYFLLISLAFSLTGQPYIGVPVKYIAAGSITVPAGSTDALNRNYKVTYPSVMKVNTFQIAISITQLASYKDNGPIDVIPSFTTKTQYYF